MFHDPLTFVIAARPTRDVAHSALAHAPTVPAAVDGRPQRWRRAAAWTLHRLADRLQPTQACSATP